MSLSHDELTALVSDNSVVIFGKGEKGMPRCGFTAQVHAVFDELYPEYKAIDVLTDLNNWRATLTDFSDWPTFPQVYVNGQFVGGCDITLELYESGELQKMMES